MRVANFLIVSACYAAFWADAGAQPHDPLDAFQVVAQPGHSIRGLAYKDGTFVAVGYSTNTVISTNGINWFRGRNGLTRGGLYAVTADEERFVAVGPGGVILSSPDGLTWTRRDGPEHDEYWAVIHGGGQFVAAGFVGYGGDGTNMTVVVTSADGSQWQRHLLPFYTTPRNLAYGKGVYVAAGAPFSMYSTNGRDWKVLSSVLAQSVAFGGGRFVAAGGATGFISSNGVDWQRIRLPYVSREIDNYYTAAYANGTFVFAGACEECGWDSPPLLATSANGTDWQLRSFNTGGSLTVFRDIIFVGGEFYLGDQGAGKIWKSSRMTPRAAPVITQVRRAGNETALEFNGVAGFRYRVEQADSVNPAQWMPFGKPIFATSERCNVTEIAGTDSQRFYRVLTE